MHKLWRGLTATMAMLLVISISATSMGLQYAGIINTFLDVSTYKTVVDGESDAVGEIYFTSEFGEINEENQSVLIAATKDQTVREMEEGAVLLRNVDHALPLSANERSVTFFGRASTDPVYRNSAAGSSTEGAITLKEAFETENFKINDTLWSAYESSQVKRDTNIGDIGEVPYSFYTSTLKESWNNQYNDVAFIYLARYAGEGSDFLMKDCDGISQLALHDSEREMIEMVTSSGKFGKVIVLLNTPAPMDLGWLDEYGIDACLWIGTPGSCGFVGVANLVVGKVNPSGRLVDSYAANSLSAPATVSSGQNTARYLNAEKINEMLSDSDDALDYLTIQPEGIYVGYKYYETRYEDCILNQGNATAAVGASYGAEAWDYSAEMVFPFGYGLSYTEFVQTLDNVTDNKDGTMTATVTVKNIGGTAGKTVVELYAQTPYGDYEKANLVEKSAIQLVQFAKTDELEPQESQTLELKVDKYLLASYDYSNAKTYILSEGTYYLAIGSDAHDALNNVLSAKGSEGMFDQNGNAVEGDPAKTFTWTEAFDSDTYSTSPTTGYAVTNQFDDCNINSWIENAVTYISRQDWMGTYPTEQLSVEATDEMISVLGGTTYEKPADAPSARTITQGINQGITLLDLRGMDYDDPMWDEYLSQLTIEEMATQLSDAKGTKAISTVNKPATLTGDGMDGIGDRLPYGSKPNTNCYTAKVLLTSSWNTEMYRRRGELMGEEALYRGCFAVFNIGGDLHRTPFGGRNFEYMSEDSVMGYLAAIPEVEGMMSKGVIPAIKHFAGNDQETWRAGVSTFFNEQAFREGDLRVFEGAIRVGGTRGLMQGLHRIGMVYDPGHYGLNTEVLRNEWGFQGFAETDGTSGNSYRHHFAESLTAGTSVYCLDSAKLSTNAITKAINENDDGYILMALRRAVKDYHFALVNSSGVNGLAENIRVVEVTPWWQIAAFCTVGVFVAGTILCGIMFLMQNNKAITKKQNGRMIENG